MQHRREPLEYVLAEDEEGNILRLPKNQKNTKWPKGAKVIRKFSYIQLVRDDGRKMTIHLECLFNALVQIRAQDEDDLMAWTRQMFEYGLLNEDIPHVRLSEIMNMINVWSDLVSGMTVE